MGIPSYNIMILRGPLVGVYLFTCLFVSRESRIRKVFRDLVIYIAGNARYTNKLRAISPTASSQGYSPAVNASGGGNDVIESNGACVPAQLGKCAGLEFSIPYIPQPNEFPRFQRETAPPAGINFQKNKHRYQTRQLSAPYRIKLSEVIPKPEPRRRRGNWTVPKKKVTRASEQADTPLNPTPLSLVPPSHSLPPTTLPSTWTSPASPPAPTLVKHSEAPPPERKPPKAYSSHQVFVTRLAEKTPMEPGSNLVKLVYVSDVQTLDSFLKKLCQKWGLPEVKGVRVEVDGQVFEVDLEEERDWEVVLGVVGGMAGVVVCG